MNPEKPTIKNNIIVLIFTFWLLDDVFGILHYSGLILKNLVTNMVNYTIRFQSSIFTPPMGTDFVSVPPAKKTLFQFFVFSDLRNIVYKCSFFGQKMFCKQNCYLQKIFIYFIRSAPACRNMHKINNHLFLTTE